MLNSRAFYDLTPRVRAMAEAVQTRAHAKGFDLVFASTLRDLEAQAVLYRTNRPLAAIQEKVAKCRARGFDFLADVIQRVGPQAGDGTGRLKTNAAPGESWHNYAEAFDAYPLGAGKLAGDSDPIWQVYGGCVEAVGLVWSGRWTTFRELAHAQLRAGANPLKVLSPLEVRRALERWL